MFERLGRFVSRRWAALLGGWVVVFVVLLCVAPRWEDVIYDGEFRYLPDDAPSRTAENLFKKTFSNDLRGSSIVIVARREKTAEGLLDEDKTYIDEKLVPRLEQVVGLAKKEQQTDEVEGKKSAPGAVKSSESAEAKSDIKPKGDADKSSAADKSNAIPKADAKGTAVSDGLGTVNKRDILSMSAAELIQLEPVVTKIRTFSDKEYGQLLVSEDQKATLIILELKTEFMEWINGPTVSEVERLVGSPEHTGELQREKDFPRGLDLSISGSATVGRDMREAGRKSAKATEAVTIVLVIVLLFVIYRAPILAVIPLLTVYVSVKMALMVLSLMAKAGWVQLFAGLETYVIVVLYGAGVDYCMFLMARYKEELDNGATFDEAIATSVGRVGHALAASAGTVMCGIGMMVFTRFGKFQQAGIAMSFSLIFVLAAALTMTPALLRLAGRWTFWPRVQTERLATAQGWISPTNAISRLLEREWFGRFWDKIGQILLVRAGTIWIVAVLLMMPFAVVAFLWQHKLSYGLLTELPANNTSVVGSNALQEHFPAGITGPVLMLVSNRDANFSTDADEDDKHPGWKQIQTFVDSLYEHRNELGIVDITSVAYPLGMSERVATNRFARKVMLKRAQSQYVSDAKGLAGQVTHIDIILDKDPFSRDSMAGFDRLKEAAPQYLPAGLKTAGLQPLEYLGATPSIRDLKTTTGKDQVRIDFLVPAVVFVILVILLRKIATSAYLILTVFFSYFVTLGLTFVVFWLVDRHGFAGLDWKVPMFLFTILVAVGEDYNILLMARIEEEQRHHGAVQGIVVGLRKTGSIISSCGIIMAGTFSALMAGSLEGLSQLGFALAAGVLLDTFVVRPVLVPAYLILLNQGKFGALGPYLGAADLRPVAERPQAVAIKR